LCIETCHPHPLEKSKHVLCPVFLHVWLSRRAHIVRYYGDVDIGDRVEMLFHWNFQGGIL
jgi:hypothetical protein